MNSVYISSDLCSAWKEFPTGITMPQLCNKLLLLTGIELEDMKLTLLDKDHSIKNIEIVKPAAYGKENNVNDFNISNIEKIIVQDVNEASMVNQLKQSFNNGTDDKLFKLSEEAYARKKDSVLQWKKDNKFGRFDPHYQTRLSEERNLQKARLDILKVNQRCSVKNTDSPLERRGWLRYIGKVPEINNDDIWCGIEFDEPMGKNDGSIKGKQYFGPVKMNYGGFVKASTVETGTGFTPLKDDDGLFSDSDDEI